MFMTVTTSTRTASSGQVDVQGRHEPDEMANVIFENYDPSFPDLKAGRHHRRQPQLRHRSSREQAATALKYFASPA